MKYMKLLTPGRIGSLEIKNRTIMAPMSAALANPDGTVSQPLIAYLKARAEGGIGLIITEYAFVNEEGRSSDHQISVANDGMIPGLKALADAVRETGTKLCLQLQHGGRRSIVRVMAPSSILKQDGRVRPDEMTTTEVYALIDDFIAAAVRGKKAGFDMVEVHCSHGYLLNDFVSPSANRRTDEFGGGVKGRTRAAVMIIQGIKRACGEDFPISVRLNGDDMVSDGNHGRDTAEAAMLFEEAGADLINISGGMNGVGYGIAPAAVETGYNVDPAELVRSVVTIPVAVAGRINEPEYAEMLLRRGKVDFITLGRSLFADPQFVNKAAEGQEEEIAPCVGCLQRCYDNYGHGGIYRGCMVNPFSMRESTMRITPTKEPRRIMVIGAGPAGLNVAWVAAARGHRVCLVEKEKMPGGQFLQACVPPHKQLLSRAVVYYASMCRKYGVELRFNTVANRELIEAYGADVVILATGGQPLVPNIPGLEGAGCLTSREILTGYAAPGTKVLVLGGGLVGAETSDFMGEHGYEVTVVEMKDTIAEQEHPAARRLLLQRLKEHGATLITSATVKQVYTDGVDYEKEGKLVHIGGFDSIVLAFGSRSYNPLEEELKAFPGRVIVLGDAKKASNGVDAIYDGTVAGLSL